MVLRTVALIEDAQLAESINDCFSGKGLDLSLADSVEKAKGLIANEPARLVLSEVHLKGGDVFELLSFSKSDPERAKIPFVMLSVNPSKVALHLRDSLYETAKKLGADLYITMDHFDCETLTSRLQNLIQ